MPFWVLNTLSRRSSNGFDQDKVVTKGRWALRARRQLSGQGLSLTHSHREFQTLRSFLRTIRERNSFELAGFLSFRIWRHLKTFPNYLERKQKTRL